MKPDLERRLRIAIAEELLELREGGALTIEEIQRRVLKRVRTLERLHLDTLRELLIGCEWFATAGDPWTWRLADGVADRLRKAWGKE